MPTIATCMGCRICIPEGREVNVFHGGKLIGEMHSHCSDAVLRKRPGATFGEGVLRSKKKPLLPAPETSTTNRYQRFQGRGNDRKVVPMSSGASGT